METCARTAVAPFVLGKNGPPLNETNVVAPMLLTVKMVFIPVGLARSTMKCVPSNVDAGVSDIVRSEFVGEIVTIWAPAGCIQNTAMAATVSIIEIIFVLVFMRDFLHSGGTVNADRCR